MNEETHDIRIKHLFEKREELNKKLLIAHTSNMSPQLITQMQNIIEEMSLELYDLQQLHAHKQTKNNGDGPILNIGE